MIRLKLFLLEYKKQLKELFWYGIFGVLTTLVNILTYWLFGTTLGLYYMIANVIAWIVSVSFAFITNKLFVFNSKSWKKDVWLKECLSFVSARILTGFLDMGLMYLMITIYSFDTRLSSGDIIAKVITNVIVIIVNFLLSKLFVFKKKNK